MKKILLPAVFATMLILSCGGGEGEKKEEDTAPAETTTNDLSSNPDYQKGLALVAGSDCLTCHKVNEELTGPPYAEIAKRYANAPDTTITSLAKKIIEGGSGNWGQIPMTQHPQVSQEDAEQMVKYILLLDQQ